MDVRTLQRLRIKTRRYVARLSPERAKNQEVDEFIFEAMRYDLPEDLSFSCLQDTFHLVTIPNVGVYDLTTMCCTDEDCRIIDRYETFEESAILGGNCLKWVENSTHFSKSAIETKTTKIGGKGDLSTYFIEIEKPVMPGSVQLYIAKKLQDYVFYTDVFQHRNLGLLESCLKNPEDKGYIYYIEGRIELSLQDVVPTDNEIGVLYKTYRSGKPTQIAFDERRFFLHPVPDDVYVIDIPCHKNPKRLREDTDYPEIDKWGDWIALQAARRIFRESWNFDAINEMMFELEEEMDRNIIRKDQNIKAKKYNSSDVYNRSSCPICCCAVDRCGCPINPLRRGCT